MLSLSGCSLIEAEKTKPTEFLIYHSKLQAFPERSPFHLGWNIQREKPEYAGKVFTKYYLKPINLDYLGRSSVEDWREEAQIKEASGEELKEVSEYLFARLSNALSSSRKNYKRAAAPGPRVLVVEAALVELRPTQVTYKLAGAAAGTFIPGGSLVKTLGKGGIAIEIRFSDGATGEVRGEIADRREEKLAVIADLNNFSRLGHAKQAIDDWADELTELLSTPIEQKVRRSSNFVLVGW
jgi:hypothetical protein